MSKAITLASLLAIMVAGCGGGDEDAAAKERVVLPTVSDARHDLVLTWFAAGGAQTGTCVADVPVEHRAEVRVQDPLIPPEELDGSCVFVADLRAPGPGGKYPVKAVDRGEYDGKRRAQTEAALATARDAAKAPLTVGPDGKPTVVMYSTKTCPVCVGARRWLLDKGIPYVEKDVGADREAAAELAAKGRAQGVSTSGVPVFDIGGRLIPGFDKDIIEAMLRAAPASTPPPALPEPLAPAVQPPAPPVPPDPAPDAKAPVPIDVAPKPLPMAPVDQSPMTI